MVSDFKPHESYQFFLQEVPELLRNLETGLLKLNHGQDISMIWELMRMAHSIKGGAACVGLTDIQETAHQLESVFKELAKTEITIDPDLDDLLLKAFDCLKSPILEHIKTGSCDRAAAAAQANPVWAKLQAKLRTCSASHSDLPQLLFAKEVDKGLKQLTTILTHSDHDDLLAGLKTQVEIFRGIGTISHLPGFVKIAQTTLAALQNSPQHASAIGQFALEDFRRAQAAVLHGDRQDGGQPSPELLQLAQTSPSLLEPFSQLQPEGESSAQAIFNHEPSQKHKGLGEEPPPAPSPLLLSMRQDAERLSRLNNLVGELVTLDNRLLAQNQQQEVSFDSLLRDYQRFKQVMLNLHHWVNQPTKRFPSNQEAPLGPKPLPQGDKAFLNTPSLAEKWEAAEAELAQLGESLKALARLTQQSQPILKQRQMTLKQLKANLLQAQMLPVAELLNQFHRPVHDLAITEGKQVSLHLQGTNTLVEKAILERLYDPLVHLVRNAFDHGIERPEVRQALGKSPEAKIIIKAWYRGNHTYLAVQDDGRGIDLDKIRAKAIAMDWLTKDDATQVSQEQLYEYLFAPNFSTTNTVSQISGRGMGLYAVKAQLSDLKGIVTIDSQLGRGTTFTLCLPLTLTITKLLVVWINRHLFALPVDSLAAIRSTSVNLLHTQQDQQFFYWQDQFVPICSHTLISTYNYPLPSLCQEKTLGMEPSPTAEASPLANSHVTDRDKKFPLLVISRGNQAIALPIDEILLEQDLVIKPFNNATIPPPDCLCGSTILGDGRLVPVLDGPTLVEKCLKQVHSQSGTPMATTPPPSHVPTKATILAVDDSLTIQHAISRTLQQAGYRALLAKDGQDALNVMQQEPNLSAIICDIEMPNMDGLEFLSRCRQDKITVPIIMLTYRSSQKYRQLAKQLGATDYLTKPYLAQDLLETLERWLDHNEINSHQSQQSPQPPHKSQ